MKMILMVFLKKSAFEESGPFSARKWHVHRTLDFLQHFFLHILHNERGQEVGQNYYVNSFSEKNSLGQVS